MEINTKVINIKDWINELYPDKEIIANVPHELADMLKDYHVILKRKKDGKMFRQVFGYMSCEPSYFVELI